MFMVLGCSFSASFSSKGGLDVSFNGSLKGFLRKGFKAPSPPPPPPSLPLPPSPRPLQAPPTPFRPELGLGFM